MGKIDLSRHGVVEAHAGTGKTWTIINELVLPMLTGQGCRQASISEIMLVTYTEKAAGELKKRIREALEKRIEETGDKPENAPLRNHLQRCLNDLHEALIGTIHSVCLRLLQSYPFETGMQFTSEMVDDRMGLEACLRESIREDWPEWGVDISQFAGAADFEGDWGIVARIVNTAQECLDPDTVLCADSLAPGRDLDAIESDIRRKKELVARVIGIIREKIIPVERLVKDPAGLDQPRIDYLNEIFSLWKGVLGKGTFSYKGEIAGKGRRGPDFLSNKLVKGNASGVKQNPLIKEACQAYSDVCGSDELKQWAEIANPVAELLLAVTLKAVPEVCCRWREKKRREGLISYQDMLRLTYDAVRENAQFRTLLRSKIRYAIIDEFQDTSVLQWEIFRRLFVDESKDEFSPRIFIVGDPKQSIYSFQNAVVESYLDARESILGLPKDSGELISLKYNYRSLPDLVDGYNRIFTRGEGFFLSERISYDTKNQVCIPKRECCPEKIPQELNKPVRIVPLWGASAQRIQRYAGYVSSVIRSLKGLEIPIPEGDRWGKIKLDFNHFAVIAESHSLADRFLGILLDNGIPAAKYKQEGVFSSSMAVEFRALLSAINSDESSTSEKLKALLTVFFNYAPGEIDPDRDLSIGGPVSTLFREWKDLLERRAFSQLFRSILVRTRVQERLIRLFDGDRRLSDLRQVMDYSLEYLIRKQGSPGELIEHLANLERGTEDPGRDQNLHAKESDRGKVQVMTMHAAKGLEFPVCFIVTSGSKDFRGIIRKWTQNIGGNDGICRNLLHVMPVVSERELQRTPEAEEKEEIAKQQQIQERRRLLYVALTRPKALLYIPMYLKSPADNGTPWKNCELPSRAADRDLTPVLQELADECCVDENSPVQICMPVYTGTGTETDGGGLVSGEKDIDLEAKLSDAERRVSEALVKLNLVGRRRIQTSYSALAHGHQESSDLGGRRTPDDDSIFSIIEEKPDALSSLLLPAGKHTGSALHEILEEAISHKGGIGWASDGEIPGFLKEKAIEILRFYGIAADKPGEDGSKVIEHALILVRRALSSIYSVPEFGDICLSNLGTTDMRAEAEFHLGAYPHWVLGYMDLVFRVKNTDGSYRYFVLDWKSNWLPDYDKASIESSVMESRYDLQAKVYCHGLHSWLGGLLGADYDPSRNLGGAVYVYLRGLEQERGNPVWFYKAEPESDTLFVKKEIEKFGGQRIS